MMTLHLNKAVFDMIKEEDEFSYTEFNATMNNLSLNADSNMFNSSNNSKSFDRLNTILEEAANTTSYMQESDQKQVVKSNSSIFNNYVKQSPSLQRQEIQMLNNHSSSNIE